MSASSSEDFMAEKIPKRRKRNRDSKVHKRNKRRINPSDKDEEERKKDSGETRIRRIRRMDLCKASRQEIADIEDILKIRRSAKIGNTRSGKLKMLGSVDEMTSQEREKTLEKIQEEERLEILRMLKERTKMKKQKMEACEAFEERLKDHHRAKTSFRRVLFVLRVKRKIGEDLPSVADLASYLFTGRKGKQTNLCQEQLAGEVLIHVIQSGDVIEDSKANLSDIEKMTLELESF